MAKKLIFILVLAVITAGGVCAQEEAPNIIMFLGSMLSYERVLSPNLGIGVEFALDFIGIPTLYNDGEKDDTTSWVALTPFSMDAFVRYYPWAGTFFAQLGLGIQTTTLTDGIPGTIALKGSGFHAKAQVGWRLDIGKPNHWGFEAKLGPGISLGGVSDEDGETIDKASYFMFSFPIQLGFGLKF